jgi:hypothetical protein
VRRRHRPAAGREDQSAQQRRRLRARAVGAKDRVLGKNGVDLVPGALIDDRCVLAGIALSFVHRLAEVGAVAEDLVDRPLVDRLARSVLGILRRPGLRGVASTAKLVRQLRGRPDPQVNQIARLAGQQTYFMFLRTSPRPAQAIVTLTDPVGRSVQQIGTLD